MVKRKKRILLLSLRNQFEKFDYNIAFNKAKTMLGGNSGNNVFQYALQKILTNQNNKITIDTDFLHIATPINDKRFDYINNNFDCIIYSPANVISNFSSNYFLPNFTKRIGKLKIPLYAIGLGAQTSNDYSLEFLKNIRGTCIEFIDAVLKTGGV